MQQADIDAEKPIPIKEMKKLVGLDVHISAFWRWATYGVRTKSGRQVRLATMKIGGRTYCTLAAYEEFVRRLNAEPGEETPREPAGPARSRAIDPANRQLDSLGV